MVVLAGENVWMILLAVSTQYTSVTDK